MQSGGIVHCAALACGLALTSFIPFAHAGESFTALYSFCSQTNCADGEVAHAGVIADASGNLYGTTLDGGANGRGVVYKLAPDGSETVLYSFCQKANCADGGSPYTGVVMDKAGNLYGATACSEPGCAYGLVFKLAPDGTETVLHAFKGGKKDGADPNDLIMDKSGNLYGTTELGGGTGCSGEGCGTVFKITPKGKESVLYAFCAQQNCIDGAEPFARLLLDKVGNLYGTTVDGGSTGHGTVFELAPDRTETVLYSFCPQGNCPDGANPYSALIMDKAANLYGTTTNGGSAGNGTVFKLAPGGTESVLYSFCTKTNCDDGAYPISGLVADKAGNLYGTTQSGGSGTGSSDCADFTGCGVVYKLATDGTETVLHAFCSKKNCTDGGSDLAGMAGLTLDKSGTLYGTTPQGGANGFTNGTVFAVRP
jgi:uncharacterized repeat protein (TIGR03803 family)